MKWIYHYKAQWLASGRNPVQTIYLRPVIFNEKGQKMVGKIVQLNLVALEHYLGTEDNPFDHAPVREIYEKHVCSQGYYIEEEPVPEGNDHHLAYATIYLGQQEFDEAELFEWADKFFILKGYLKTEYEKATANDFLELNPLMRLFSMENAKKFEGVFGKDWWKK